MKSPRALLAAFLVASLAGRAATTAAATFVVDSPLDQVDAVPGDGACQTVGGTCTLRAAVQEANALAGADTIDVPAGTYVLTIPPSPPHDASSGALYVSDTLVVTGAGAATTILDGNGADRLFTVDAPLDLSGVTVLNGGTTSGLGGGIAASAPLVLTECIVTGNSSGIVGGGIYAVDLTLARSTVSDNTAEYGGGGVAAVSGSVRDSTITGNTSPMSAPLGGDAILVSGGGTFAVANSTVDGELRNLSFCQPPPVPSCSSGDIVTLSNVTIDTVQQVTLGGGDPGTLTLKNTIARHCGGIIVSGGYNLFEHACSVLGDTTGNVVGVDPLLEPLADNGGPTQTRKPRADSPVREAGNPAAPASGGGACEGTDQRGVVRPVGPRCDIGAVEGDCGDGLTSPGEECDDGNLTNGDGCDANCTVTGCGNGIVTAGEACDDGNLAAGDCCGPTCQPEAAGSPCAADGNVCRDDVCDGAGACTHPPNTAPCDDGNPCTTGDHCASGGCLAGTFCEPCLQCDPSAGCVVPTATCAPAAPAGSKLTLVHGAVDRVAWRWKSAGPVAKGDFGNPVFTYPERFCVYDGGNNLVLSATASAADCGLGNCWRERNDGFRYRNETRLPDGLQSMDLTAGDPGKIRVRGKGPGLDDLGVLPLATPVRVRVFVGDFSACWGADFDAGVGKNTASKLMARSD